VFTDDDNNDNPIIIRPHIVFTDDDNNDNPIVVVVRHLALCGRIMIGLSLLSSGSKHNMWSYYDWVVVVFFRHIVFTDGRQRQPIHNTTTYCVY
jgi:hypothetical protein